jgi:hypothetical protein
VWPQRQTKLSDHMATCPKPLPELASRSVTPSTMTRDASAPPEPRRCVTSRNDTFALCCQRFPTSACADVLRHVLMLTGPARGRVRLRSPHLHCCCAPPKVDSSSSSEQPLIRPPTGMVPLHWLSMGCSARAGGHSAHQNSGRNEFSAPPGAAVSLQCYCHPRYAILDIPGCLLTISTR